MLVSQPSEDGTVNCWIQDSDQAVATAKAASSPAGAGRMVKIWFSGPCASSDDLAYTRDTLMGPEDIGPPPHSDTQSQKI